MTIDPLEIYGWPRVYYRQVVAQPECGTKKAAEQWGALRAQVLAHDPPGNDIRRAAIESIRIGEQADVLAWLDQSK
jgi:hypothetical protein